VGLGRSSSRFAGIPISVDPEGLVACSHGREIERGGGTSAGGGRNKSILLRTALRGFPVISAKFPRYRGERVWNASRSTLSRHFEEFHRLRVALLEFIHQLGFELLEFG
jgi:hypothetical protein